MGHDPCGVWAGQQAVSNSRGRGAGRQRENNDSQPAQAGQREAAVAQREMAATSVPCGRHRPACAAADGACACAPESLAARCWPSALQAARTALVPKPPAQVPSYEVAPTVGLSVEEFETDSIKFQAFDMSGEVSKAREKACVPLTFAESSCPTKPYVHGFASAARDDFAVRAVSFKGALGPSVRERGCDYLRPGQR